MTMQRSDYDVDSMTWRILDIKGPLPGADTVYGIADWKPPSGVV
jgi:hypothetical protein